jgi:predicted RNase H-like nuclease
MLFVGIDLAWSERNNSGIAIINGNKRAGKLTYAGIAVSDKEIVDLVSDYTKGNDALIAIDAPLIVPNKTGRRKAEALVGELFRRYDAGAHPANRDRLGAWSDGKIRGEVLVNKLGKLGFSHDPSIKRLEHSKKLFEVYPHPSMVVLFNLNRILQYKAKPKRTQEFRVREFEKYGRLLKTLRAYNPSLSLNGVVDDKGKLKGMSVTELKKYEDRLDAIFCAYIAYYYWVNPERCRVLGNMKEGYIMTPVFEFMRGEQKNL